MTSVCKNVQCTVPTTVVCHIQKLSYVPLANIILNLKIYQPMAG